MNVAESACSLTVALYPESPMHMYLSMCPLRPSVFQSLTKAWLLSYHKYSSFAIQVTSAILEVTQRALLHVALATECFFLRQCVRRPQPCEHPFPPCSAAPETGPEQVRSLTSVISGIDSKLFFKTKQNFCSIKADIYGNILSAWLSDLGR